MDSPLAWLQDYTLRTVILGTLMLGLGSGALGSFALLRRQSLLGDAVSHAALPGLALAYLLLLERSSSGLLLGAALSGLLGATLILVIARRSRLDLDSAQALVLSVFFGLGLLLLSHIQGLPGAGKAGLDKFLFGQAAALLASDLWVIGAVDGLVILLLTLFWKELKTSTFDPSFAHTIGIPRTFTDLLITSLMVMAIVVGLSTVGVILMSALLVAPAAAARQWTKRLGPMVILAALFGAVSGLGGALLSSRIPNGPTGPLIVLILSAINLVSLLLSPHRGLLARAIQNWARDRYFTQDLLLNDLARLDHRHASPGHPHSTVTLRAMDPRNRGVSGALRALRWEGLVREEPKGHWALTPEGITKVGGGWNHRPDQEHRHEP